MKRDLEKYPAILILLMWAFFLAGCKKENKANNLPVANFTFVIGNTPSQAQPAIVTFTNTSQRGNTYQWYFGDGGTSIGENPVNFYTLASYTGVPYTVKLVVTNSYGKDSITKQVSFASTFITGVSNYALPNSLITITGFGFSTAIANNTVTINGVPAIVSSATATAVMVTVPANATSGPLVLTTNGTALTVNFNVYSIVAGVPGSYADRLGGDVAGGLGNNVNIYFKHISYTDISTNLIVSTSTNIAYDADWEADSVRSSSYYASGTDAGGFSYVNSSYQSVPTGVKTWGITRGYVVGSNDYRIYKAGIQQTVFAGSGVSGYADGQGTSAQFAAPKGMAADAAGNLYVNDAHRIRKISTTGLVTTLAGSGADGNTDGQGTAASFGNLYGICVDAAGNVYVSDNEYLNIRKITPTGTVTTLAGSGVPGFADGTGKAAQFYFPKGMAVNALGNLFLSDSNYNTAGPHTSTIRMISSTGVVTTVLSSNKGDKLSDPDGIAYADNRIVICNTMPGASIPNLITGNFIAK